MVGGMVLIPLFGAAEGLMLKGQILLLRPLGSGENRLQLYVTLPSKGGPPKIIVVPMWDWYKVVPGVITPPNA